DLGSSAPAKLWDHETATYETMRGHDTKVTALAFSPDGKQLVAGGDNPGVVSMWSLPSGTRTWTSAQHTQAVTSLAFSRDGRLLATASQDRTVRFWNPANGALLRKLEFENPVLAVAFSPDAKLL